MPQKAWWLINNYHHNDKEGLSWAYLKWFTYAIYTLGQVGQYKSLE